MEVAEKPRDAAQLPQRLSAIAELLVIVKDCIVIITHSVARGTGGTCCPRIGIRVEAV